MLPVSLITSIVFAYLFLLFFVAYKGDRTIGRQSQNVRNVIYGLSLAVYCSSWTFLGAVGSAVKTGWDYFAIFLGPILLFTIGLKVVRKIIFISKQQNITTISDFISTRFGGNRSIAMIITVIAVIGALPYIALQLKAISMSFNALTIDTAGTLSAPHLFKDSAFYTAIILIIFSIMFGTRHYDATEHHKGVISAIAFESIIKLVAILVISGYAVYLLLTIHSEIPPSLYEVSFLYSDQRPFNVLDFIIKTLLSLFAAILLPRQFHVGVVEAENDRQVGVAAPYFVLYLLVFSIVIAPITLAGISTLSSDANPDLFVLTLPLLNDQTGLAILAYIGAVSAATGMVIVCSIAVSTMVCNDLALPWLLKNHSQRLFRRRDFPNTVLLVRRITIAVIILFGYGYYTLTDGTKALANIGLISFAATAQFAPAVIAALYWRQATARGIRIGLMLGFAMWAYTLLLPTLLPSVWLESRFLQNMLLHPEHLFNLSFSSPLAHGVIWSLLLNVAGIVLGSLWHKISALERLQASSFVDAEISQLRPYPVNQTASASYADARSLCDKIIGIEQTSKLFDALHFRFDFNEQDVIELDHLPDIERSLAAVVGNSTAKRLVQQVLVASSGDKADLLSMVDQTTNALRFSQSILQSTLEHISQAISVVDSHQNLIAWNSSYAELFDYPDSLLRVGTPIKELLAYNAAKGDFGDADPTVEINKRLQHLRNGTAYVVERRRHDGTYLRIQGNPTPNGGFVTSYSDITELKTVEQRLEQRVEARTRELEHLTQDLKKATEDKTRFLAAASHDLLQPINAARLFAYGLKNNHKDTEDRTEIADKIDQALCSADDILRTLLNISQLDRGSIKPNIIPIQLDELIQEILNEMTVLADKKSLQLRYVKTAETIESDYRLLFLVLQNIISNAIRYTHRGKIVIGCRRHGGDLLIQVHDTGVGISKIDQESIFEEFSKGTQQEAIATRGVGLGLSIVKRICQLLRHDLSFASKVGVGSMFAIRVPRSLLPAASGNSSALARETEDKDTAQLSGTTVLCLDNDLNALSGLNTLLSEWGCNVLPSSNLDEAEDILSEDKVDFLLADYQLDFNELGLDLLLRLKNGQINTASSPAMLLVTATQDDRLFQTCHELSIDYMHKPLDPALLQQWLLKHLPEESTGQESEKQTQ